MSLLEEITPAPRKVMTLFYIVDTSGSMCGSRIGTVNAAMEECISLLKEVAQANDDVEIKVAILAFSSGCYWITPPSGPVGLEDIIWNDLQAGGMTEFGGALYELDKKLSGNEYLKSQTGAYAPIILFLSDGGPTDDWEIGLKKIKQNNWFKHAIKIAIDIESGSDRYVLEQFTGNPEAILDAKDTATLKKMIHKVSIRASEFQSHSKQSSAVISSPEEDSADIVKAVVSDVEDDRQTVCSYDSDAWGKKADALIEKEETFLDCAGLGILFDYEGAEIPSEDGDAGKMQNDGDFEADIAGKLDGAEIRHCPLCGSIVSAGQKFCVMCGSLLTTDNPYDHGSKNHHNTLPSSGFSESASSSGFGSSAPSSGNGVYAPFPADYSFDSILPSVEMEKKRGGGFMRWIAGVIDRKKQWKAKEAKNRLGEKEPVGAQKHALTPEVTRVEFSAIAPKIFVKGDYSILHVIMYEKEFREAVDRVIAEAAAPVGEIRSGGMNVAMESHVRIRLDSPDVEIRDPEETRVWTGEYLDFTFAVALPKAFAGHQVLFTASVYINDLIATKLHFTAQCVSAYEQKIAVAREDILSAFVSYASQDRSRVAAIVQGMSKARPDMDIFFDVESLRSGMDWETALQGEIEKRDIFFLCWSLNARSSEWVQWEWRYALTKKGLECIEPIPIDPPSACPPPEELKKKHFNDRMLFVIKASE